MLPLEDESLKAIREVNPNCTGDAKLFAIQIRHNIFTKRASIQHMTNMMEQQGKNKSFRPLVGL